MSMSKRMTAGMRTSRLSSVPAALIALTALGIALAGLTHPDQAAAQAARGKGCSAGAGLLGVSRVVEIDTARGARFGLQQYPEHDFLRENEVVLTFDDGPLRRYTTMVLEALAAHCTQATFFMVGQMALTDPAMVQEVARAGHTIAIHTWSHRNLRAIGATNAQREVELGISAVQRALGKPVAPFFRFPYLADSPAMLEHLGQRNFATLSIDVDSRDFRTHNPREMQRTVMGVLAQKRKGILLFHDIQTSTAHGIRGVLDELASRNYRVVHIVPKATAATQPSYDAMAEAEFARRNKLAAANPMNQRAVVYPMTPPNVPVEQYQPGTGGQTGARPAPRQPSRAAAPQQPAQPQQQPPAAPPAAAGTGPAAAAAAAPAAPPPGAPQTVPTFRGTADQDDWRRGVFQQ